MARSYKPKPKTDRVTQKPRSGKSARALPKPKTGKRLDRPKGSPKGFDLGKLPRPTPNPIIDKKKKKKPAKRYPLLKKTNNPKNPQ